MSFKHCRIGGEFRGDTLMLHVTLHWHWINCVNYQQLPVRFVFENLAVGQREESQAGWVASRLVMMLWRPASTWGLLKMLGRLLGESV